MNLYGKIGKKNKIMKSYSQAGQDLFVYHINNGKIGKFLDLGCSLPKKINNTYLLELSGWDGISLDIQDFNQQWKERNSLFIQTDCLNIDYNQLLNNHYSDKVIDYLTLDMEGCGDRFKLLQKVFESEYSFKIITIEHDSYLGENFIKNEKIPQRDFLKSKGYKLVCSDISHIKDPNLYFEDWWVNPQYFDEEKISLWESDKTSCDKIFDKLNINYEICVD
jgi:hypothetical protein